MGETAADYLAGTLGFGRTVTSLIMCGFLVVSLAAQFRARRYVPGIYWLTVVLVSVGGTLISDSLVDNFGASLWTTTLVFGLCLAATFAAWFRSSGLGANTPSGLPERHPRLRRVVHPPAAAGPDPVPQSGERQAARPNVDS